MGFKIHFKTCKIVVGQKVGQPFFYSKLPFVGEYVQYKETSNFWDERLIKDMAYLN